MSRLGLATTLVVVLLIVHTARLWREGTHARILADKAAMRRDEVGARHAYEQALRAYVPGAPHVARALAGLSAMADHERRDGRSDDERATLSTLRSGLLGARSFYLPFSAEAEKASRRLAVLTHTDEALWWPPPAPVGWALCLGYLGLATMAAALLGLGPRALSPGLRVEARPAVAMGVAFTVGLTLFMVGMRLA